MDKLDTFLAKDSLTVTEECIISSRFCENGTPVKWKFKSISEAKNRELRRSIPRISGTDCTDYDTYLLRLASVCTVYPDLKSSSLQNAYGVRGAASLLEAMLLPGEYALLLSVVTRINGFDESEDKLALTAKK